MIKLGSIFLTRIFLVFSFSLAVLATLTLATPTAFAAASDAPPQFKFDAKEFEQQLKQAKQQWQVPGLAVAVVTKDNQLFSQTLGTTKLNVQGEPKGQRVDEHTVVPFSSTSKGMIALAALVLVEQGKLKLDDKVAKYIPELKLQAPYASQEMTVRDVLAQRVGLESLGHYWLFIAGWNDEKVLNQMPLVDFAHSFRSEFSYSNTLYHFMGLLVTRASGQSWQSFIQSEVWQPLGMHSTYLSQQHIPPEKARMHGHYWNGKKTKYSAEIDDYNLQFATPTGSFWTTLHDTKRYLKFLLNRGKTYTGKQLVKPELLDELFKPQVVINRPIYVESTMVDSNWRTYGLGWFQQDIDGIKVDYHTGSQYGLSTMLGLDLKRGVAYAMFNNRDHAELRHAMLWHLMDAADGHIQKDWNKTIHTHYVNAEKAHYAQMQSLLSNRVAHTKPSLPLGEYAGTYKDKYGAVVTVEVEDTNSLRITDGIYSDKLEHWHFDSFYTTGTLTLEPTYLVLTFDTDYTGKIAKVSMGKAVYYRVPDDTHQ